MTSFKIEREAGIKRENIFVNAPELISLLNERRFLWLKDIWLQRGKFQRKTKKPYKYQATMSTI